MGFKNFFSYMTDFISLMFLLYFIIIYKVEITSPSNIPTEVTLRAFSIPCSIALSSTRKINKILTICSVICPLMGYLTRVSPLKYPPMQAKTAIAGKLKATIFTELIVLSSPIKLSPMYSAFV